MLLSDFHDAWPWSAARWSFVGARMAEPAPRCWYGSRLGMPTALASARTLHALDDPHLAGLWPEAVKRRAAPRLFADVERPCASFYQWWTRVTRGVGRLHELPGLAALLREGAAGPLFDSPEEGADRTGRQQT